MDVTRRKFLTAAGSAGLAASLGPIAYGHVVAPSSGRRFKFAHVDVFTQQPLLGNPLDVFLDARGMSDADMLAITRETFLSEAAFILPRDAATEREHGVRVKIFTPDGEIPFAGHPTLGTAMVLRDLRLRSASAHAAAAHLAQITLDLNVGKIPVTFMTDGAGRVFGEIRQVAPDFGAVHDKEAIAQLHDLAGDEIADDGPIQTVSTGLSFAIVPLKRLSTLQSLRINAEKMRAYLARQPGNLGFYYITRDTGDADVAFRSRCLWVGGEDAATGSAAGCTIAWMVCYGSVAPDKPVKIRQGVEMKRPSDIIVRASRDGDKIVDIRVGGYAVQTIRGELML
ncbi:MAG: PhzF family phenazine biosynthesis protein [Burkholderiaceae bacterium]|nr:PhzF family phenazine biosynthesis protein [Burkholderiaceae bacterium]